MAAGPFALFALVSVTKTLLTKHVFEVAYIPIALSAASCLLTAACLVPALVCWRPDQRPSRGIACAAVFTLLDLAFTNIALANLSVPLQQCLRATAPMVTLLIECALRRTREHPLRYVLTLALVLGPIIVFQDAPPTPSSRLGVASMALAVVSSSAKNVAAHAIIKDARQAAGMLAFTFYLEVCVGLPLVPWAALAGEVPRFVEAIRSAPLVIVGTALYGGVRLVVTMRLLQRTSPTTLAVANQVVQVFTVVSGACLFDDPFTEYWLWGAWLTLALSASLCALRFGESPR